MRLSPNTATQVDATLATGFREHAQAGAAPAAALAASLQVTLEQVSPPATTFCRPHHLCSRPAQPRSILLDVLPPH